MAGVLYSSGDKEGVEASGVFLGVLKEDMIDTVKRVKKPFIDVFIEKVFFEDADYPLTYVPMFNMVLPLKKGHKVWVYFNQENHRYPVLWKLADNLDESFTGRKADIPSSGSLVTFPNADDTTEVLKISDDIWFIATVSYGVLHWGDQCLLLNGDCLLMNAKTFGIKSGGIEMKFGNGLPESKGRAVPKADTGFLCAVPNCLFTGAPHCG